jgi:hypothetical protein
VRAGRLAAAEHCARQPTDRLERRHGGAEQARHMMRRGPRLACAIGGGVRRVAGEGDRPEWRRLVSRRLVLRRRSEANAVVKLYDGSNLIGTVTANAAGAWSVTTKLPTGTHSYTETATDAAGNAGKSLGAALFSKSTRVALTGGSGDDVLVGGSGDTLSGGAGHDRFVSNRPFGLETVNDFSPVDDTIVFDKTLFSSFDSVMSHAKQSGTSVLITYDNADVVTLKNVSLTSLTAADFVFV